MSIIKKALRNVCIFWEPIGINENGDTIVGNPVDIKCRWDFVNNLIRSEITKDEITSNAVVMVDRTVPVRSILMFVGREARTAVDQLVSTTDPYAPGNPRAYMVQKFEEVQKLSGTEILREATV